MELDTKMAEQKREDDRQAALTSWVMDHVDGWRRWRDSNFQKRWAEYYRLWRGFWQMEDKQKDSERSKLIAPALQQAIEMTVAEMEEATFGRGQWIDVSDDYEDQDKEDILPLRDQLLSDLEIQDVPAAVAESFLNGALYGTGIGKIMIGRDKYTNEFKVWVESIAPKDFVIDPAARTVDEALGCAHEIAVPRHKVLEKMRRGVYYKRQVGQWNGENEMFDMTGRTGMRDLDRVDTVFITEYHGLVPKKLLDKKYDPYKDMSEKGPGGEIVSDDGELVEAIITIANKNILVREVENPYTNKDRAIIAYQHETVPAQFWGRGVAEKGYNPQKALDAELRARIDALGLMTYPIMGADATRLPRGLDLKVRPGRMFLLNGRPSEILEPITFGNLDPASFQNSADLERMVQMGTGAMDSAMSAQDNTRNSTVGGMSMQFSGFIKRSKRTMQNVERRFLSPLVQKIMWRYMQFDPERYPLDFKFKVKSAMGIMAREVEQTILGQLIQTIPPEHPAYNIVIKGIIENGASPNKAELIKAIEQQMAPKPEQEQQQQMMQKLQLEGAMWTVEELKAKVAKLLADAESARAKAEHTAVQADLEDDKVEIMAAQTVIQNKEADVAREQMHSNQREQHTKNASDSYHKEADREVSREANKQKAQQKKATK